MLRNERLRELEKLKLINWDALTRSEKRETATRCLLLSLVLLEVWVNHPHCLTLRSG